MSQLLINLSFLMEKPTGISTYARNLLPSLRSLNPILLTSQEIPGYSCYQVPANMTPEQGSLGHFSRLLWTQFQLPKIYRQHRSQLFFSPVTEAPLFAGCRSIVMVHDLIPIRFPRNFSPLTNYTRYWVPLVLRQAEHILCNSYSTAQDITQFFKISSQKITPIPLAYQADHFRFLDLPKQNYFLYLGRIDLYKNVQRLITAFANLPQRSQYQLWIAGPADQRFLPALIAQIERLKLTAQVKFLNYVSYTELPTLINQAIALVFPSLWEGFGLPVLEAMACGTPVIASNLSSLPEFTGKAALLIDPYQVAAITEAMEAVSSDAGLAAQLRDRGLAQANQFSWAKTGAATAAVLQQYL